VISLFLDTKETETERGKKMGNVIKGNFRKEKNIVEELEKLAKSDEIKQMWKDFGFCDNPSELKLKVDVAFNKAILEKRLSATKGDWNYSGDFMWMGVDNGMDMFKHRGTRRYLHAIEKDEKLIEQIKEFNAEFEAWEKLENKTYLKVTD